MKKIMMTALAGAMGCITAFAEVSSDVVTNVYDFTMSLKTPILKDGVRNYKSQKYKGYAYFEYAGEELVSVWAEVTSGSTKVAHHLRFADGFYNLMGKTTAQSDRSVPTLYFEGEDVDDCGCGFGHEAISSIVIAGTGSLKSMKTEVVGCGVCGVPVKMTDYCNLLWSGNGNVTGVMDCECPDEDEGWWHTVKSVLCGVWYDDDGDVERKHEAAFWGSWSMKFNKKLSDTKVK